jgi:5'/3'-nucleotidase SurE
MADDRPSRNEAAKPPRILVTNDDGINAAGLRVLERIARTLSPDVWVVAPETNQSGASHSLTMQRPLRIRKVSRRRFAVDGTPPSCCSTNLPPASATMSARRWRRSSRDCATPAAGC